MSAECLWCHLGSKSIANPIGDASSNPLGCCHRCQAFACGNHAQYDYTLHQYVCFQCDVNGIIKSADELNDSDQTELSIGTAFKVKVEVSAGHPPFSSFEDLKDRRPGYKDWLKEISSILGRNWANEDIPKFLNALKYDSQLLYIAAAMILHKTDGPNLSSALSGYPDIISAIIQELNKDKTQPWS